MTEPKRLIASDVSSLERLLLRVAASERPSSELSMRMRSGLGLPTLAVSAKSGLAIWGQGAILAVATAGVVGNSSAPGYGGPRNSLSALASASSSLPAMGSVKAATSAPGAELSQPAVANTMRATSDHQVKAESSAGGDRRAQPSGNGTKPMRANPTLLRSPQLSATRGSLREEIELLDRTRAALHERAPIRALELLAQYGDRFPQGAFRQEASVLRIEALQQNGQPHRAATLARQFLLEHPESPHAQHVTSSVPSATRSP